MHDVVQSSAFSSFYYLEGKPLPIKKPLLPSPWQPPIDLLSCLDLPVLDASYKWSHAGCDFCGTSLISYKVRSEMWRDLPGVPRAATLQDQNLNPLRSHLRASFCPTAPCVLPRAVHCVVYMGTPLAWPFGCSITAHWLGLSLCFRLVKWENPNTVALTYCHLSGSFGGNSVFLMRPEKAHSSQVQRWRWCCWSRDTL